MQPDRRAFLTSSISLTLAAGLTAPALSAPETLATDAGTWLGCRAVDGSFRASLFNNVGDVLVDIPLPGRGHGLIAHPDNAHAIAFARRPGTFALLIDLSAGILVQEIQSSAGRHFYGHGCFSHDGKLLYTTENDIETGEGIIGVRDASQSYALIASFPSDGIGPHEIGLMADGNTLAVANGGIKTMPDLGRAKLNLDTMTPSLVFMNRHTGQIEQTHKLAHEFHQLSIRHMSISSTSIALALQYEGPKSDHMPFLAIYDGQSQSLQLTETPEPLALAMRNYGGSVAHDPSGRIIGVTSPRGNIVSFWDAHHFVPLETHTLTDVCGIAPGTRAGEFLLTGGAQSVLTSVRDSQSATRFAETQWDNHLIRIA